MSIAPVYRIRPIGPADLKAVAALRDLAGPGFTSLAVDDATLKKRLAHIGESFASRPERPGAERYLLGLEHLETGALVGLAGVKAMVGWTPPFFNFRVLRISQSSFAADRRFDLDVLIMVNEFTGCSEVGTLFVAPEHRAGGIGRALAQTRYLMIAADPERFCDTLVSELRGVSDEAGRSPFWEHLGRQFFRMDFTEADRLSATTDNQFILDLMPKYPIYVDLLPPEARAVIGQCHPLGQGAQRLLEWEGFRYTGVVDVFDAGPLMTAPRDSVRTRREAKLFTLKIGAPRGAKRQALLANPDFARFACTPAHVAARGEVLTASPEVGEALGLEDGQTILAWVNDAR